MDNEHLAGLAKHTLDFFEHVADSVSEGLREKRPISTDVLAGGVNTLTAGRAIRNLDNITEAEARELRILAKEPAIARIVAEDESGKTRVYFIARGTPNRQPTDGAVFASYRAPMGKLAATPVGNEVTIPAPNGGRTLLVLERAALRPREASDGWDSVDSTVEGAKLGPLTVRSFRALLGPTHEAVDVLEAQLAEDVAADNVLDGLRRSVIAKMELRDQPLLDQYQDEIFRLPLDSRLVILGPPGTGKTTTLIKRLGLKRDLVHLSDEERELIQSAKAGMATHLQSWVMFTPTALLKQYVKEAFARESIAASDLRIQTWADARRDLARQTFGILRSSARTGLVMRDELTSLQPATLSRQPEWFADFDTWQTDAFWSELRAHAALLAGKEEPATARIGARLSVAVGDSVSGVNAGAFLSIAEVEGDVQGLVGRLKNATDAAIRNAVTRELERDKSFLDQLATFSATLGDGADDEESDPEDEEEIVESRTNRLAAYDAYARAIRAHARAASRGRMLGRQTRYGKIIDWLGDRQMPSGDLRALGSSLQVQRAARPFVNPVRRYIFRMPLRYRAYRRDRQAKGEWYLKDGFSPLDIGGLEVDLVLLAILRGAHALIEDRRIARRLESGEYAALQPVRDLYRTQVAVDEATDFSPLQLGCMAAFCDPAAQSFIACGDFNQRITEWGSREIADLQWVFPRIDIRPINITYRHSRQLNELARTIALLSSPDAPEAHLPPRVDNDGVEPVLRTDLVGPHATAEWLGARIVEIEQFTQALPSIAVLVSAEDEVIPLADALNQNLAGRNIRAVACSRGVMAGQDNDVRVFDVQHIKGLEFEAVFFVGIDRLAALKPDLFDKYLYVGATRAAMYLGLTTEAPALPRRIAPLQSLFKAHWSR